MAEIVIDILPALQDNYIYVIRYGKEAIVVDPGDSKVVEHYLEEKGLTLEAILITHHHEDHVSGLLPLKEKHDPEVFGPKDGLVAGIDTFVHDGDTLSIGPLHFTVIHTPGHTKGHVVYYEPKRKILFSGDTLFCGGCGRIFEGNATDMYGSFLKLGELDPLTDVYCGHEYTVKNLEFASQLDPSNSLVQARLGSMREKKCTMPFLLRDEFETNPYFRVDEDGLKNALNMSGESSTAVFAEIRRRKDLV